MIPITRLARPLDISSEYARNRSLKREKLEGRQSKPLTVAAGTVPAASTSPGEGGKMLEQVENARVRTLKLFQFSGIMVSLMTRRAPLPCHSYATRDCLSRQTCWPSQRVAKRPTPK